jgi:signal transduction histidine kinase
LSLIFFEYVTFSSPNKDKNKDNNGLTTEDHLTIKTGELIAKTQELDEANESLHLLNNEIQAKIYEVKNSKNDLTKSENSLLMANEELAKTNEGFVKVNKELASVNKELARVNEQIKQHNMKQKEFIHIASHELRTPTQSILGYIELLLSEPQSKFEYGERIMRNANRLQKIISDILYLSKIDNNMLMPNYERFNLAETILQVVEDTRNQIIHDKKNVNIIYDAMNLKSTYKEKNKDIVIEGDKERIGQVISNILDNAVRFMKEGAVTVSVDKNDTAASDMDDNDDGNSFKEVTISIKDSGKGIDPGILPRLFSKFTFKEGTGGTGLGLYICKSIVESHGGRIWAENNEDGKGATFRFSLPMKQH